MRKEQEIKFETLKKSRKKQIIIVALAICAIGGALTFNTTRAKYRLTQSIKIVEGEINYKPYDFKIMAMYQQKDESTCTEDSCYNEITDRMPSSGYVINESKSYCTLDNKNKDTQAILKTVNGIHGFSNLKKTDKCYIWFDKKNTITIANNEVEFKTSPTTFTGASTTDEGVYAVSDGMYGETSYYWRGAATTNHVIFANKCWRIIRINGDKTIRLIYNGTPSGTAPNQTCPGNGTNAASIAVTSQTYSKDGLYDQSNYVGWTYTGTSQRTTAGTSSNAKTQTENWFNNSSNFTDAQRAQVAYGKFCNDRNAQSGSTWAIKPSSDFYYAVRQRTMADRQPTLSCPSGDVYTLKVGAITADEVMFAGGWNTNNTSYYLYNGKEYWTMSPYDWYGDDSHARVFRVNANGFLTSNYVSNTYGLRPVINLNSDTTFASGGLGTSTKPYVVQ